MYACMRSLKITFRMLVIQPEVCVAAEMRNEALPMRVCVRVLLLDHRFELHQKKQNKNKNNNNNNIKANVDVGASRRNNLCTVE